MLTLSPSVPIYLHPEPIDMLKSFDGLFGIIKSNLCRDMRDGGLFMFLNQRLNRLKILYWDTNGIAIWMKRHVIITHAELQCILSGVDLSSVRKRKRYVAPSSSVA
jgi:transposase